MSQTWAPRRLQAPWITSARCDVIVSRLPIRVRLARLRATLQYVSQIDNNLGLLLQRLPDSGQTCKQSPARDYLSKGQLDSLDYLSEMRCNCKLPTDLGSPCKATGNLIMSYSNRKNSCITLTKAVEPRQALQLSTRTGVILHCQARITGPLATLT
jgi:hypothetical protein